MWRERIARAVLALQDMQWLVYSGVGLFTYVNAASAFGDGAAGALAGLACGGAAVLLHQGPKVLWGSEPYEEWASNKDAAEWNKVMETHTMGSHVVVDVGAEGRQWRSVVATITQPVVPEGDDGLVIKVRRTRRLNITVDLQRFFPKHIKLTQRHAGEAPSKNASTPLVEHTFSKHWRFAATPLEILLFLPAKVRQLLTRIAKILPHGNWAINKGELTYRGPMCSPHTILDLIGAFHEANQDLYLQRSMQAEAEEVWSQNGELLNSEAIMHRAKDRWEREHNSLKLALFPALLKACQLPQDYADLLARALTSENEDLKETLRSIINEDATIGIMALVSDADAIEESRLRGIKALAVIGDVTATRALNSLATMELPDTLLSAVRAAQKTINSDAVSALYGQLTLSDAAPESGGLSLADSHDGAVSLVPDSSNKELA